MKRALVKVWMRFLAAGLGTIWLCAVLACATSAKKPVSSVVLRSKLDKKIVALNVELRDHRLGQVALKIAEGRLETHNEIAAAMAEEQVPYVQWEIYRGEKDDLDAFVGKLRRLSPARCGLVDKPQETAICARSVVELNKAPTRSSEGDELRIQGAAQGSAIVEQILVMSPDGSLSHADLKHDERAFEAGFTPPGGEGLYTIEVVARTGRGIEPAARWWLRVGSADIPEDQPLAPETADANLDDLGKTAFAKLNSDRQSAGVKALKWSGTLAQEAASRAAAFSSAGALSPPNQEKLAKLRVENSRAISRYSEVIGDGDSVAAIQSEIMQSPSKRRSHLDSSVTSGAVAVTRGKDKRLYLVEVSGKSYDPNKPAELRDAIVDRVNMARLRKGIAAATPNAPLQRYAQQIAERNLKRNGFLDKDDLGRTVSDAILGDLDGLQFAGSEMFRVNGAEEVTPGATPTDKRFTLVGVGAARKKADMWWVVILVAAPE